MALLSSNSKGKLSVAETTPTHTTHGRAKGEGKPSFSSMWISFNTASNVSSLPPFCVLLRCLERKALTVTFLHYFSAAGMEACKFCDQLHGYQEPPPTCSQSINLQVVWALVCRKARKIYQARREFTNKLTHLTAA